MNRIVFLDVDGVMNTHRFNDLAESCSITEEAVNEMNKLIAVSGAGIVISSAWRYMMVGGTMNTAGFHYMLRTHGLTAAAKILGFTMPDEMCAECQRYNAPPLQWNEWKEMVCFWCKKANTRAMQVRRWLLDHREVPDPRYVVIDDLDLGFSAMGLPFVHTDGAVGLTAANVEDALHFLGALK